MAHIIVLGNEKGGSGKSTTAMHLATALARAGHVVGALDLDLRQRSLHRYLENRCRTLEGRGGDLGTLIVIELPEIAPDTLAPGENLYDRRLSAAVAEHERRCDFIVIDCPGSHTRLSQVAHSLADTLITPLNDSYIDFDLLARVDASGTKIEAPSVYSEMVWQARKLRAHAGLSPIDWVVMRNRVGPQQTHNKRKIGTALDRLAQRIGFRTAPGFSERVIFRELFPTGMTLLDLRDLGVERLNISNVAAREELRGLLRALRLPGVAVDF